MVNLAIVLNTELDHALDELGKVRVEVTELQAECTARHYLDGGSPAPVGIQHPYRCDTQFAKKRSWSLFFLVFLLLVWVVHFWSLELLGSIR
jgi:hypothetical protein